MVKSWRGLIREINEIKEEFEKLKQRKLKLRSKKYEDMTVDWEILFHHFLQELGEFFVAVHGRDRKLGPMMVELMDLSNLVDAMFAYLRHLEKQGGEISVFYIPALDVSLQVHKDERGEYVLLPPENTKVYLEKEDPKTTQEDAEV